MKQTYLLAASLVVMLSCSKKDFTPANEQTAGSTDISAIKESVTFAETGSIDLGDAGASEISAYDPLTKKLFVVNNGAVNKIDVVDLSNPSQPVYVSSIPVAPFGGLVNSVAVNNGRLAAAIESVNKTDNGKAVIFKTSDYSVIAAVTVGALPDMITFSPDGNLILTANEGEPSLDYTVDPLGTVSIIRTNENYAVTTLDFSGFASQKDKLVQKGFRIFGPNANFAQDIEPEYIAISNNSKTAWVTLQENNGIASIDLKTRKITEIFPLGFKNYNIPANAIDASDRDSKTALNTWPVKGMYQPDGIAVNPVNGTPFLYTANEGDAREYNNFVEAKRIGSISLDANAFPNAAFLQDQANLGRLNITSTLGDTDGDGDYDELYSFGARSFSIWNGETGALVFDSKNELDQLAIANNKYVDTRSDDKSTEPEGITTGRVGNNTLLFIGLERADAVVVYDITNPVKPSYLQWLNAGVAPEGVLFVNAANSPTGKSLLIVSNETDGQVKIYSTL